MNKKIIVLGGTGFIGHNVLSSFASNPEYKTTGTYHEKPPFEIDGVDWVQCDLTNPNDVERVVSGQQILIQAAATTSGVKDAITRPDYHVTDNAVMNSLIFRSAFRNNLEHVIFFSCTNMLQSSSSLQTEDDFDPRAAMYNKYFGVGWTKVYLEKMCEFFSRQGSTKFTAIRHSNVYGPWDKFGLENSHVFGATITKVLQSEGAIKIWGKGEEKRDLLYVSDLVDLIEKVIKSQTVNFELLNAGGNSFISIRDLTLKIASLANKKITLEYEPSKPTVDFSVQLDNEKAERKYSWIPATSLDEGITRTINFWNSKFL
jgi:GDP-L-fucose synthase